MSLKIINRLLLCGVLTYVCVTAVAQTKNTTFQEYINKYKAIAVEQMDLHGIPASITLAQGLLESGAGKSELARKSNNHFGIKCGSNWFGPTCSHFDDGRNECFRAYDNARASFEDHSQFLKKERYARLFRLSILDYKGWARGLKACGYATSPTYADRLIDIIELYELNKLDRDPKATYVPEPARPVVNVVLNTHHVMTNNDVMCIKANAQDTWESIAKEFAIPKYKLLEYNEAIEQVVINPGDFIYLQKKQKKGHKHFGKDYWHHVKQGESMYSIAQLYGMKISSLYKLNYRDEDYVPFAGDLLRVR